MRPPSSKKSKQREIELDKCLTNSTQNITYNFEAKKF